MRIATWNVNSLKARLDKVLAWLPSRDVDVLLMQETKLADQAVPHMEFRALGYELAHHGEGRWNGVAIASRLGVDAVSHGFSGTGPDADGARFIAATCGGVRVISVYAPNGRALATEFYEAKLAWFERLRGWLNANADPAGALVLGGDMNVAPEDEDVWDPAAFEYSTHTSDPERAAFRRLLDWGLVDVYRRHHPESGKYSWWDYRAGHFHKGFGMRIDHLLVTEVVAMHSTGAEIDREARKNPTPSDHAPVWVDVDAATLTG